MVKPRYPNEADAEGEERGFLPLAFVCRQPLCGERAAACSPCKQAEAEPTARVCFPAVIRALRASLMGRQCHRVDRPLIAPPA